MRRDGPATSQFSQFINAPRRMRGVFYGWWLVVLSGLTMTVATVPLYHAMAIWSVALESHFGWSRGQLGLALTFTRIEGGLMGPLEGYLTDRLGARRMVLIGLLILGVGFVAFAGVRNLWMFYAAFIIMALGQGLGSWLPLMTTLNNWFVRRRTMAMGWSNVGSRLGALLLVPAIAWAIDPEQMRVGWQLTALIDRDDFAQFADPHPGHVRNIIDNIFLRLTLMGHGHNLNPLGFCRFDKKEWKAAITSNET